MPFGAFGALIDRIVELVRERQRARREAFDLIVRPLFEQLGPLVADYLVLVREVRRAIEQRQELNANIGYDSADFRVTRRKLQAMSEAIEAGVDDLEIRQFVSAVRSLFTETASTLPRLTGTGIRSIGRELTDLAENVARGHVEEPAALAELTRIESELHDRWIAIAYRYAELQLRCLVPSLGGG